MGLILGSALPEEPRSRAGPPLTEMSPREASCSGTRPSQHWWSGRSPQWCCSPHTALVGHTSTLHMQPHLRNVPTRGTHVPTTPGTDPTFFQTAELLTFPPWPGRVLEGQRGRAAGDGKRTGRRVPTLASEGPGDSRTRWMLSTLPRLPSATPPTPAPGTGAWRQVTGVSDYTRAAAGLPAPVSPR